MPNKTVSVFLHHVSLIIYFDLANKKDIENKNKQEQAIERELSIREILAEGALELAPKYIETLKSYLDAGEDDKFMRGYKELLGHAIHRLGESKQDLTIDLQPIQIIEATPETISEYRQQKNR